MWVDKYLSNVPPENSLKGAKDDGESTCRNRSVNQIQLDTKSDESVRVMLKGNRSLMSFKRFFGARQTKARYSVGAGQQMRFKNIRFLAMIV